MRTDAKIGIAVGVFVLLVGVIYYVATKDKSAAPDGANPVAENPAPKDTIIPPTTSATPAPTPAGGPAVVAPTPAPSPVVVAPPSDPDARITMIPVASPVPVATPAPTPAPAATPADKDRTYTVAKGDTLYKIAATVYGDGNQLTLIAKANPSVDPNVLREGQTITIPPLPKKAPAPGVPTTQTAKLNAGEKSYTVVAGDGGLWKIAEKMYGNGKYYSLIQKANPQVNSAALKVGQVLVIPPKPSELAATTRPMDKIPGTAVHTVKAGETLLSIAQKYYGDSSLSSLIVKANSLTSNVVKEGQSLAIPPRDSVARSATSRPSVAAARVPVADASRPRTPAGVAHPEMDLSR